MEWLKLNQNILNDKIILLVYGKNVPKQLFLLSASNEKLQLNYVMN